MKSFQISFLPTLRRRMRMQLFLIVLTAVAVLSSKIEVESQTTTSSNAAPRPHMHTELHPTGALIKERSKRRRLWQRQHHSTAGNETNANSDHFDAPADWFHPWTRAVYATLHPAEERDEDFSGTAYDDFVKYRHLSRFERQLRTNLGWDMHPYWHGNYANTSFYNSTQQKQHRRRQLLESMVGGRFDKYQGVPLSQGYGTHYVHLWVGSPTPQRQSVIVDTGSHFTGFPVKGTNDIVEWKV
jgi:hypothetical protein